MVKNLPASILLHVGSIPGSGRSPGGGNGNLLRYSCLGNPRDRGARPATVCGVTKESDMTEQLNSNTVFKATKRGRQKKVVGQARKSAGSGSKQVVPGGLGTFRNLS